MSEGGSDVFTLDYFNKKAFLAQSPQLYKQMAINADFKKVYTIGPVFRSEKSYTHRHLCEFNGLDVEMEIKKDYHEIIDLIDDMFIFIFDKFNEKYEKELNIVNEQYKFTPLKYAKDKNLRITYKQAIDYLNNYFKNNNEESECLSYIYDINTKNEKLLGKIISEKYETDFYIIDKFPSTLRPFYTMPDIEDNMYSNSYDVFIRGEEIISGSQRIHDLKLLKENAESKKINTENLKDLF